MSISNIIALRAVFVGCFVWIGLLLVPKAALAQVVLNEFSSATNPEWVELYNPSSDTVSLEGWTLLFQDNPETTQKVSFVSGDIVGDTVIKWWSIHTLVP